MPGKIVRKSARTKSARSRASMEQLRHGLVRPLDKGGFVPLYYQIQRELMGRIQSGALAQGDSIPSEEELSRAYHVSRMTARQALHGLKVSGFAFSEKGRGTFVTRPKLEKNIMHLQGFTRDMHERGMVASSKLLEQSILQATDEVRGDLKINFESRVMRLRRLRLADGIPMAIEESLIPLQRFPGIERVDFSRHSLYAVLRDQFGVRVGYADETIEALPASRQESELLGIPRRASILSIRRILFTTHETPIESACSRYRGDRYRALIRVPMNSAGR